MDVALSEMRLSWRVKVVLLLWLLGPCSMHVWELRTVLWIIVQCDVSRRREWGADFVGSENGDERAQIEV